MIEYRVKPEQDRAGRTTSGDVTSNGVGRVLARNMSTLSDVRRQEERTRGLQERIADTITRFTGSMAFVYLHALVFGSWIAINAGWTPVPRFDPSFVVLAMIASVEAIFLSTFVLISQNRMTAESDKRAELDLQISLLAEHEISRIAALLDAVADHLGVKEGPDPDIEEAKRDIDPAAVSRAIND